VFNWTFTYREESDFGWYYPPQTGMVWQKNEGFNESADLLRGKKNGAAAVVSNCADESGRLGYIRQMQEYFSVDVYGKCGRPCSTM